MASHGFTTQCTQSGTLGLDGGDGVDDEAWMYVIVMVETKGVSKLSVDLIAGNVLSRRAEMVWSLVGQMVKVSIPWLLDSASKRWASRSL